MKKINKQDLKSAMIIAFSLVIMMGSLYVGFTKGRIDEAGVINDRLNTPGLEDLVINKDSVIDTGLNEDGKEQIKDVSAEDVDEMNENVNSEDIIEQNPSQNDEISQTSSEIIGISLDYPVKSTKIVMDYSFNTDPVYSKTFDEYRSDHDGIDYNAEVGEEVFAAADGTISKICEDEKLGYTVIISHDGYESRYSNLDQAFTVKEGDEVSAGDVIGNVGKSAVYESAEDSHVHFSVYINGECVDPKLYMQ